MSNADLTEQAKADRADFICKYLFSSCTCYLNAPCGYCTHPGNPDNQNEDPECWGNENDTDKPSVEDMWKAHKSFR